MRRVSDGAGVTQPGVRPVVCGNGRVRGLHPDRSPGGVDRPRGAGRRVGVRHGGPDEVAVAVVLDLLHAAFAAGIGVPAALAAVGSAVGGSRGRVMTDAAAALTLGARWAEAWICAAPPPARRRPEPTGSLPSVPAGLGPVADALRASWEDGAPPGGAVRAAAAVLRREHHARALEAAARLGVRLVLPLGLCYLPAFVLVGLVPVLVSMASGVLGG